MSSTNRGAERHADTYPFDVLPRESLRFVLRSLRLHVKELNKRNYENRIMLEREMEVVRHNTCNVGIAGSIPAGGSKLRIK